MNHKPLALLGLIMMSSTGHAAQPLSSTHPNAQLISSFYEAFSRRDGAGMGRCYSPDVHFSDEVFPELHGARAAAMWRMLCKQGADLRIEFSGVEANDSEGRAHWEAWYTFSKTGRSVHNIIEAKFSFQNGLIVRHADSFDFLRWSKQALGVWGHLIGWTSFLKNKIRQTAAKSLDAFIRENP